jgi:hypothetical protein
LSSSRTGKPEHANNQDEPDKKQMDDAAHGEPSVV